MHDAALLSVAFFALAGIPLLNSRHFRVSTVLRDYTSAAEDQWSWTTHDGRCFENVEVLSVDEGVLIFEHSDGIARVGVNELSGESLERLHHTSAWLHPDKLARN